MKVLFINWKVLLEKTQVYGMLCSGNMIFPESIKNPSIISLCLICCGMQNLDDVKCSVNSHCISCWFCRPSMSGLHLVKQGRDRRRVDLHRDFTVASPAEFVTRFGGNKVIEKVNYITLKM